MNAHALLIGVSEVSGGVIAILGVSLVGTLRMLGISNKRIEDEQSTLRTAIDIAGRAEAAKDEAEKKFKEYSNQVADYLKRPSNVLLTEEQVRAIAEAAKSGPEAFWPKPKVQ